MSMGFLSNVLEFDSTTPDILIVTEMYVYLKRVNFIMYIKFQ